MVKYILALTLGICAFGLSACTSEPETEGARPDRQGKSGELPWARPASWEGGLPGMSTNAPRQY